MERAQAKMKAKQSKNPTPSRIPEFASIEEEAEFWDTHSSTDFEDEFEHVEDFQIEVVRGRGYLSFRMDEELLKSIEKQASDSGIEVEALIQKWIEVGLSSVMRKPRRRVKAS